LYPKKTPKLKNPKHLLALGCVDGSNGWQQQKQRMCIDQVQNQRTTKEESSCTMHMHFICASLVVHLLSISPRSAVVCAPLLHIALLSLRSLSRLLGVVSFFGFFSFQWSIFHLFQTKKEEHPK
jgi:hypothetical protein